MNLGLEGKRALILASSAGLGLAVAQELAAEGAHVVLSGRDAERLQAAVSALQANTHPHVHGFVADVGKADDLRRLVEDATAALGGLDILVSNAGGPPAGGFDKMDEQQWELAYELTLQSVVRSVRYALPHLRSAGGGSILALASSSVKQPIPNLVLSNVFRPAVHALCKTLASELAADGIRVNCISPGRILTDRTDVLDRSRAEREQRSLEEVRASSIAAIPMGRLGEPREFGRMAAFLCSEAASYVTGSSVLVDGGMVKGL